MDTSAFDVSSSSDFRLPNTIVPEHYDLTIEPNLENFTFDGVVHITLNVKQATRRITLHSQELSFSSAEIRFEAEEMKELFKVISSNEINEDKENTRVTLVFGEEIPVGVAHLQIRYRGIHNSDMAGFYRSTYEVDGKEKTMLVTQCEDTDARRILPCFDEPAMKATFECSLVVPSHLNALSNTPVERVIHNDDGTKQFFFGKTPRMSSYLLAFAVGELEYVEAFTENGTHVRVYTTEGKKQYGHFALDTAVKSLEFYEEYYQIPYPLPKLDLIAVPDFAAGAMENWGLVTFREEMLLVDPAQTPASSRQLIALVVAHELNHMWFGNLVTMEWWTQLWLNEGLTTFMQYMAVDHIYPEYRVMEQFAVDDVGAALAYDGLRSTHPVEIEINHPSELSQAFDAISYQKGAVIVRMLHDYLGPETFRKGMQIYLNRFAYGNAVTEDLWQAFEDASGEPVRVIMDAWTKEPGFPVLTVEEHGANALSISQERFLANGTALTGKERAQKWDVACKLSFEDEEESEQAVRIDDFKQVVDVPAGYGQSPNWLKLNAGETALARVNYSPTLRFLLGAGIESGTLPAIDRHGLISDAFALAQAGYVSAVEALQLVEEESVAIHAGASKPEYAVWTSALSGIQQVRHLLDGESEHGLLDSFANGVLESVVEELHLESVVEEFYLELQSDDEHLTRLLRPQVMRAAGLARMTRVEDAMRSRFWDHYLGRGSLEPDLREAVYAVFAHHGDDVDLDALCELYHETEFQEEKARLLGAVGSFAHPETLKGGLEFGISEHVRPNQILRVMRSHSVRTNEGNELVWRFFVDNFGRFCERYGGQGKIPSSTIEPIVSGLSTEDHANEAETFFEENPIPEATRALARAVERVRTRAAWAERDRHNIVSWLKRWHEEREKLFIH